MKEIPLTKGYVALVPATLVSRKGTSWRLSHRKILRLRDGDNCWLCGSVMKFDGDVNCGSFASIEHVIPLAEGGSDEMGNLKLSHRGCNSRRNKNSGSNS